MSEFVWSDLVKGRTYYKATLVQPVDIMIGSSQVSRYEPETLLLTQEDYARIQQVEKELVKEVGRKNEEWFRNALTVRQVERRFSSSCCMGRGITLDRALSHTDAVNILRLRGVRIYKNHWVPIWVAVHTKDDGHGAMMVDIDAGDILDATAKLQDLVDETCLEIKETIRLLEAFSSELRELSDTVHGSSMTSSHSWQEASDQVYRKISLYRSGIVFPNKNISLGSSK